MQTLLVNSVPHSWSLLTKLQVTEYAARDLSWSLVEQQCPQLQALAMNKAVPLCLTALTSLTCSYRHRQLSVLSDGPHACELHSQSRSAAQHTYQPLSGLFSWRPLVMGNLQHQHLKSQ